MHLILGEHSVIGRGPLVVGALENIEMYLFLDFSTFSSNSIPGGWYNIVM